jgi:S-adenosylmethionine decarboxylase
MVVGTHVYGTLHGCNEMYLKKVESIKKILKQVVIEVNFHAVGEIFHQFQPEGVTGVILLAESHISIHTWPERNLILIDVFTCGKEGNAEMGFDKICSYLSPQKIEKKIIQR